MKKFKSSDYYSALYCRVNSQTIKDLCLTMMNMSSTKDTRKFWVMLYGQHKKHVARLNSIVDRMSHQFEQSIKQIPKLEALKLIKQTYDLSPNDVHHIWKWIVEGIEPWFFKEKKR